MIKRILIVDDHSLIRTGVKHLLSEFGDTMVAGEASTAEEALGKVRSEPFDLIILDVVMPGRSGLDIIGDLREANPKIKIIILSTYPEEQLAIRCYRLGVDAFVSKRNSEQTLAPAIRTVLSGKRFVSRETAELMADYLSGEADQPPHEQLTERELEILVMIGSGCRPQRIADALCLSVKTINTYRGRILEKMRCTSTTELVKYVVEHRLLPEASVAESRPTADQPPSWPIG